MGLARWVVGRTVADVEVRHPRAVRRHTPGGVDFVERLRGATFAAARRRGKYLWLPLAAAPECLTGHLGMSGQLVVQPPSASAERHLHVRFQFTDGGPELRFIDQRTFGGLLIDTLIPTADLPGDTVPSVVAHIARDPLDPAFGDAVFVARVRRRHTAIKRALLDQTLISGVGNIYADEALWRARLHGERDTSRLTRPVLTGLLDEIRGVLREAIAAGGTSFDSLYVDINGYSGYFDRTLAVYGRDGLPCPRCGTPIRRSAFMNRSSFFCSHCQRRPRRT